MKRLCVFAHFDAQNEVKGYILHFLRELRAECDHIVFVSTSALPASERKKLEATCGEVLLKENVGLDFGMWKHALKHIDVHAWDELVLCNSSVFGPLEPLARSFGSMATKACDFWGMTDSFEISWHVQSYFLVFRSKVLHSDDFAGFWRSILPYSNKSQIIRSYEVGLSAFLTDRGYVGDAVVRFHDIAPASTRIFGVTPRRLNPTCFSPARLVARGMPFVKVELLRDNPQDVPLGPVYREMARFGYDKSLIQFDRPPRKRSLLRRVVKKFEPDPEFFEKSLLWKAVSKLNDRA